MKKLFFVSMLLLCCTASAQYSNMWIKYTATDSFELQFRRIPFLNDSLMILLPGRLAWIFHKSVLTPSAFFAPINHTHPQSEVTNLTQDLAAKAPVAHTHAASEITGLVGYVVNLSAQNAATTTDAQIIYFGVAGSAPTATDGTQRVYIPKAGTIKSVYVYANAGTAGTGEAWILSVRKNSTTDTQIQSLALSNVNRTWSNASLSIAVVAGDYIEIKSANPTWATNPANVKFSASVYIE